VYLSAARIGYTSKYVITDLVQIRQLGEKKQVENGKFRRYLKRHNFPELKFRRVAEEIESAIDCRACANCCRVAETDVTERDIARLSRYLGLPPREFVAQYTTTSAFEQKEPILRRRESGCIFLGTGLDCNDCTIYEARPDTCRDFPHLVRGAGSFESRMWQMVDRATYCPIVYNSLEKFKGMVNFNK
jgi:Fe-S-cluster containining protein